MKRLFLKIRNSLKIGVIIGDVLMTLHVGMLLSGIGIHFVEYIFGLSLFGFIVILASSYLLGLCRLYRIMLIHGFIIRSCCMYLRTFGFGIALTPLRYIMFILGIILFVILIIKIARSQK